MSDLFYYTFSVLYRGHVGLKKEAARREEGVPP
jgi:hypothetical protein